MTRPTGLPPLAVIDPITLQGRPVPERKWIVSGLVPHNDVTILAGDGGKGKSLLILQLLVAAALGRDWLGRHVMPCKSLGIFCEDSADEIHRRLVPILDHYDADFADLENLQYECRRGQESSLMGFPSAWEPGEVTALHGRVMNYALDFGAQIVALDSLHDFYTGNENIRTQARQFVKELTVIAEEIDGAVVLSAHPSVAGRASGTGESGSTAWNNACRSRLFLTSPTVENGDARRARDTRVLTSMKANYAASGGEITMKWHEGVFIAEDDETGMMGYIAQRNAEKAFLSCLDAARAQGRDVSDSANSPRFAPKIFQTMGQSNGLGAGKLRHAMNRLFDASEIEIGPGQGPGRHTQKAIVRTNGAALL